MLFKSLLGLDITLGVLCLIFGLITGDEDCLGAGIGMFVFLGIMWGLALLISQHPYQPKPKSNSRRQRQDDYDNYWGIIDWHDK